VRAKDAFHLDFAPSQEMIDKLIESPPEGVSVRVEKTNATLFDKVKEADRVINKAYAHFDNAFPVLQKYENKKRGWVKWLVLALASYAICVFLGAKYLVGDGSASDISIGTTVLLGFIAGAAGIFAYVAVVFFIIKGIVAIVATKKCKIATEEKLEGIHILQAHEYSLRFLPEDYLNPLATGYLVKITADNRVTDLNDALDRCDAYLRHTELQSQLQSMNDNINYLRAEVGSLNRSVDFWGALNFYK
jgi:hypothetical protein